MNGGRRSLCEEGKNTKNRAFVPTKDVIHDYFSVSSSTVNYSRKIIG